MEEILLQGSQYMSPESREQVVEKVYARWMGVGPFHLELDLTNYCTANLNSTAQAASSGPSSRGVIPCR